MKSQRWFAAFAICVLFAARLFADDSSKTGSTEQTNPPAGKFAVLAPDWTGSVNTGQFLAALAFSNQLGIEVAPVEPPLRAHLDLKEGQGVVVTTTAAEGEAAKDGLKPHDIVLSIDGHQVASPEKFHELAGSRQGKEAVLRVLRNAKPVELKVTFPNTPVYQFANNYLIYDPSGAENQYRIGVSLAQADDVLRSHLRLADDEGLVITDVVADGPSAKAGLRKNDVLVKLDGKRLTTVEACNAQVQEIKDRKVTATIFRGGKEISVELTPQLSTTAWDTAPYLSTVLLNNGAIAADQQWAGRLNLNTLQGHANALWQPTAVRWDAHGNLHGIAASAAVTSNTSADTTAASAASTGEQIAQLKRQLTEMQKSLAALEAALQPEKSEQSQQAPEQKPQEQPNKQQP